jgi:hypothetical protein
VDLFAVPMLLLIPLISTFTGWFRPSADNKYQKGAKTPKHSSSSPVVWQHHGHNIVCGSREPIDLEAMFG